MDEAIVVRRGTTPTVEVSVSGTDADWGAARPRLAFSDARGGLLVREARAEPDGSGGWALAVELTQAETLAWPADTWVEVQVRAAWPDGTAEATDIGRLYAGRILMEGEVGP